MRTSVTLLDGHISGACAPICTKFKMEVGVVGVFLLVGGSGVGGCWRGRMVDGACVGGGAVGRLLAGAGVGANNL